ncbi:MAG: dolichyl-phosphate-mannose--protein O-mannosyl transferase, partial [Cyanobacteria bacterium P01_G01_bin.49]
KQTELGKIIYDVHAMGNPILWWLATSSVFSILCLIVLGFFKEINYQHLPLFLFILANYFANLLPWIFVTRCTFLYHYMASYVFSWLGISWIIEQYLSSQIIVNRRLGIMMLLLISIAFVYWLPIYLGMPLSSQGFKIRMFGSWI